MGNRVQLPVKPEVARRLLSKSLSRFFNAGVSVIDYEAKKLSRYRRKSVVHKVHITVDDKGEGSTPNLPHFVVTKFYSKDNGDAKVNEAEYRAEKDMLIWSDKLAMSENKPVYPQLFSGEVNECDRYLAIVREFRHEKSLTRMILDKRDKDEPIYWTDINGTNSTMARLHVHSPWLKKRVKFPEMNADNLSDKTVAQVKIIANTNGIELEEEVKKGLKERLKILFLEYLSNENSKKVISGDLNVSPRHATPGVLLDAGRTMIGPVSDDQALYSDPIFSVVLDQSGEPMRLDTRGEATVNDYIKSYNNLAKIFRYRRLPDSSQDDLLAGFWVSSMVGGIKGASATFAYGNKFLEYITGLSSDHTQSVVEGYNANVYNSLNFLKDFADRGIKNTIGEIEVILRDSGVTCDPKKLYVRRSIRKTSSKNNSRTKTKA
jgi:hypothetical protein